MKFRKISLLLKLVILVLVVWGFAETAATFSPIRALRRELLPTFGLPTIATKADLVSKFLLFIDITCVTLKTKLREDGFLPFSHMYLFHAAVDMVITKKM